MIPAASVSFFRSEFNEFLYAPIGSENNGMTLSVLTALARLNIDPWEEAAELSKLPKESAAQRLASLIARIPAGPPTQADCDKIADRLIEFLPRPHSSNVSLVENAPGSRSINPTVPIMIAAALAALLIAATWEPYPRPDHDDVPSHSTGSPTRPR